MDTKGFAFEKPKDQKKERGSRVRIKRDGREVCSKHDGGMGEYQRRKVLMWRRQNGICCLFGVIETCPGGLRREEATFEHENGRGGGKRNDALYIRNDRGRLQRLNGVSHGFCNCERGSRRTPLFQPKYRKAATIDAA